MLREIDPRVVRQREPGLRRCWYHDFDADLCMDFDTVDGTLVALELDWEGTRGSRPYVRWRNDGGVRTGTVDTGDCPEPLHYKRAPILALDGFPDDAFVGRARQLIERAGLPELVGRMILERLKS
jgi:hypothetical protein